MTWASLSIEKVFLMGKVFNIHFDPNCRNYEFRKHLGIYLENHEKNVRRWEIQVCPLLSTRIRTLSPGLENNNTLKYWSGIFPTTLIYAVMVENSWKNSTMYGCPPIQRKHYELCWNLMKAWSQCAAYVSLVEN